VDACFVTRRKNECPVIPYTCEVCAEITYIILFGVYRLMKVCGRLIWRKDIMCVEKNLRKILGRKWKTI